MPLTQVNSGLLESGAALANIGSGNITPAYLNTQAQYTGFKNRLINGGMVIDQRNNGAATANTINGYTVDRWAVLQTATGKLIAQQNAGTVTPPAGFINYLGVTSQSAYSVLAGDIYRFVQQIEGLNVADLGWGTANAATVTLSFWVRSSLTGTFGGAIGNSTGASTYPFTYTISSANTWEQKTLTIPGPTSGTYPTNTTTAIYLQFALGLGSSTAGGTANTWGTSAVGGPTGTVSVVGTNGATWYITGVQLEKGSTATSFDYRPYGTELQLCQRYYVQDPVVGIDGYQTAGAAVVKQYYFPVTMRISPASTTTQTGAVVTSLNTAATTFSIDAGTSSTNQINLFIAATAAGRAYLYRPMQFSAEL